MTDETKRVALYLRVSTSGQHVANQRPDLLRWVARTGYEVVAEYADEGISGTKGRDARPELDRLLRDASRRNFDVVACWDASRFGRSTKHMLGLMHQLEGYGVAMYFLKDGVDTTGPMGELLSFILSWVAEQERERIRERSIAGQQRARAEGKRIGRPPVPDVIQRRAAALLRAGESQRSVRKKLHLGGSTVARIAQTIKEETP